VSVECLPLCLSDRQTDGRLLTMHCVECVLCDNSVVVNATLVNIQLAAAAAAAAGHDCSVMSPHMHTVCPSVCLSGSAHNAIPV